ncbi:MAG: MFS transporter [Armatimonadetes bacterium]|nr:MFS transporter [Armatimonadota bacterium]
MKARESATVCRARAVKFIVLLGIVSLFADVTYEGARSITGPFLGTLGASATVVGVVSGFGELVGHALRLVSGYISDRTRKYWAITLFGYVVNLLVVPALALAGRWEIAAALIIAERFGKAIRNPPRDAILSHATSQVGHGWGFGLHEALDQIGAVLGPLIVSVVLFLKGTYQSSFAILIIPALMAISVLIVARILYPTPRDMERATELKPLRGFPKTYWLYLVAVAFIAAGYTDYPLIAYHFGKLSSIPRDLIPTLYALAMGVDAVAALIFGRLYDRIGLTAMVAAVLMSAFFAPLVFLGGFGLALAGVTLWGIGMGAQESIMRAAIAGMISAERRGTAYGVFNTGYGIFWFAGSALMGYLYDVSVPGLIAFSVVAQLASIPILIIVRQVATTERKVA